MKYICKKGIPDFFIEDTKKLNRWNEYYGAKKRALKKHILENEQLGLCCYCEHKITEIEGDSHLEHVIPKSIDLDKLTFDYNNILVSCEGNHFNEAGDFTKDSCGHRKEDLFDNRKFLNATLVEDISSYFIFDKDTGEISSSQKDKERAKYTLELLNLNGTNNRLAEARLIAKKAFLKILFSLSKIERQRKLQLYLQKDNKEFITFFRFCFLIEN